jgi:hypothetical protein
MVSKFTARKIVCWKVRRDGKRSQVTCLQKFCFPFITPRFIFREINFQLHEVAKKRCDQENECGERIYFKFLSKGTHLSVYCRPAVIL